MIGRISRYEIETLIELPGERRPIDCSVVVVGANWRLELEHIDISVVPRPGEEVQITWTHPRGRAEIERAPEYRGDFGQPPEDMKL
jgi:hypothetical protein